MDTKQIKKEEETISKGEQHRRAKEKAIQRAKIKKTVPWAIFLTVIIGGLYWATSSAEKRSENRPGEEVAIQGRDHISPTAEHDPYNSNPPTSGPHAQSVPWGFYEEEILDENAVHNLEHGGIWITYKDLDEASVDILRDIAKRNSLSVVVSPRAANDSKVALASWGRLETMDSVDVEAITRFIQKNKNQSPERLAR